MFGVKTRPLFRATVVLLFLVPGGFFAGRLFFLAHSGSTATLSEASSTGSAVSTRDVPESVVKQVTNSVSGVAGIDQMVVLPAQSGNGYSVTAQIVLGSGAFDSAAASEKIQDDTTKYFGSIFSKEKDVVDAEVYFLANGQIVASAGLGTKVYHELAAKTGIAPYNLALALESMSPVSGQGENNSWFEIGNLQ